MSDHPPVIKGSILKFREALTRWHGLRCGLSPSGAMVHVFTGEARIGQKCHCGQTTTTTEDVRLEND